MTLTIIVLAVAALSVVVLGLSIRNLVRAIKSAQTARWSLLRSRVHLTRAQQSLDETMTAAELTLLRLKELNGDKP